MTSLISADKLAQRIDPRRRPTVEQREVIEAPLTPMVVIAGAGSGKTETMAARVVWLVANALVEPQRVLGLTFTRKAAAELAERVRRHLSLLTASGLDIPGWDGSADASPTIATYDSFARTVVAEYGVMVGVESDATLITAARAWSIASQVVERSPDNLADLGDSPASITAAVQALDVALAEHLRTVEEVRAWHAQTLARVAVLPEKAPTDTSRAQAQVKGLEKALLTRMRLLDLVEAYRLAKADADVLEFHDQMAAAAQVATGFPTVAQELRRRYGVVLLDEFQDTSEAQLLLMAALFADAAGGSAVPMLAVGDPFQAIYGWRGASAGSLDRFRDVTSVPGRRTPVASLSTSWRNPPTVLDVANAVATPLRTSSRIAVKTLAPSPLSTDAGEVCVGRWDTAEQEAEAVAAWLVRQRRQGRSCAILSRKVALFELYARACEAAGLVVWRSHDDGLLAHPAVCAVLDVLTMLDDPGRGDAAVRVLTSGPVSLGPSDLAALWAWASELHQPLPLPRPQPGEEQGPVFGRDAASILDAVLTPPASDWLGANGQRLSEEGAARVQWLSGVVQDVAGRGQHGVAEQVAQAIRALGLDVDVRCRPGSAATDDQRALESLVHHAAQFEQTAPVPSMGAFLTWVEAARTHDRGLMESTVPPPDADVHLLTVHKAKGLEWDAVAVPALLDQSFPLVGARRSPQLVEGEWAYPREHVAKGWWVKHQQLPFALRRDHDQLPTLAWDDVVSRASLHHALDDLAVATAEVEYAEERRLAYVAMTRAQRAMLLTCSGTAHDEAAKPAVTSEFLVEAKGVAGVEVTSWAPPREPDPESAEHTPPPRVAWPQPTASDPVVAAAARELTHWRQEHPGMAVADPALAGALDRLTRPYRRIDPRAVRHLSASALVAAGSSIEEFVRQASRPLPVRPSSSARSGTVFHTWVEQYFCSSHLPQIDVEQLAWEASAPWRDDGELHAEELNQWKDQFLRSPWASRVPVAIERDIETVVAGVPVRTRIDAVFAREDGGVTVVDWKTGRAPRGKAAANAAFQLGLYAVAYSELFDMPLERVDAAFYYVASGETVHPPLPSREAIEERICRIQAAERDVVAHELPPSRG